MCFFIHLQSKLYHGLSHLFDNFFSFRHFIENNLPKDNMPWPWVDPFHSPPPQIFWGLLHKGDYKSHQQLVQIYENVLNEWRWLGAFCPPARPQLLTTLWDYDRTSYPEKYDRGEGQIDKSLKKPTNQPTPPNKSFFLDGPRK